MGSGKKYAVLLCAEDSDYVKKKYGGYFGVFVGMLAEEGETWDRYRVVAGEFPGDGEIAGYDGFVISGSCSDAHGNDVWICKLLNFLKKLDSMKKKVLGICFGHQALGGPKVNEDYGDIVPSRPHDGLQGSRVVPGINVTQRQSISGAVDLAGEGDFGTIVVHAGDGKDRKPTQTSVLNATEASPGGSFMGETCTSKET